MIKAYRDKVVAEGRVLINAEVEAMRNYMHQVELENKQLAIDEACKTVYGVW